MKVYKWQVLNAKDYGIPQNRERCFMVSILGDYYYEFPSKTPLKLRLKDMLEVKVDKKYYLTDSTIERISKWNAQQDPLKDIEKEKLISPCLTARGAGEEHSGMVLISEPVLLAKGGKIVKENKKQIASTLQAHLPTGITGFKKQFDNGVVEYSDYSLQKISKNIVKGDTVGTITANTMQSFNHDNCHLVATNYRIRKLTPKECWRLMGFSDQDIDNAIATGMSDTQLYRQAGNSIVVNVLMAIFLKMI